MSVTALAGRGPFTPDGADEIDIDPRSTIQVDHLPVKQRGQAGAEWLDSMLTRQVVDLLLDVIGMFLS